MKANQFPLLLLLSVTALSVAPAQADEAADRKAEIQRKREESKRKAEENRKAQEQAAADKAAADKAAVDKAAADKAAADKAAADKAAADKAAADKAAADKAAADKAAADKASGGTGGSSGASDASAGGTGGAATKAAGGAGGASTVTKVEEKDAPLPAGDIETLRQDRADRRKATVERLRRRWGSVLANEKGAADLKLHSRRVALLQRVRVVAETKKDKKTIEAVDELLTLEDERHSKAMNALREGALSVGGAP